MDTEIQSSWKKSSNYTVKSWLKPGPEANDDATEKKQIAV